MTEENTSNGHFPVVEITGAKCDAHLLIAYLGDDK